MPTELPRYTNRLAKETSPYLLQHANNPVDWYPWGEEALARAKELDKPILLSVGYSSCHWCHVMERESFEDPEVASLMNEAFVCVKVDREERPDVDAIYMQATLALRGSGGWPMNVFLTPELEPFYAGTYFPPVGRFGMPSWPTVVTALADAWSQQREKVVLDAQRLTARLQEAAEATARAPVGAELTAEAAGQLADEFDEQDGGFGSAPKFPRAEALELLLRHHRRSGDSRALHMVTRTLDAMARGGIYDHLAGGFARYSTDAQWLVPHFEKMLYDNALLTRTYLGALQVTGSELYRTVATETLDYVLREMTAPEGGFYSATDADSEGVEGKFFVWSPEDLRVVLDPETARRFCAYFDVSEAGNWEGKSILNTPKPVEQVAEELGIGVDDLKRSLNDACPKVYTARQDRVAPGLDDKRLTAWNALMIGTLAEGFRVLGDARYLDAARKAASFLLTRLVREDGGLLRSFNAGQARFDAYLEDYAYLADALIDLYEAGGDPSHLAASTVLAEKLLGEFAPVDGGAFYFTAKDHEQLLVRSREGHDGAIPNPSAVAARALARLSYYLNMPQMRAAARAAIEDYGGAMAKVPRAFCTALGVIDLIEEGPVELALIGEPSQPGYAPLWEELSRHYLPHRLIARASGRPLGEDQPDPLPLVAGKELVDGAPAVYVCKDFACQAPATDPHALRAALSG